MHRRSFLAIAGSSLLAGCTTQFDTNPAESTETTEPTPSETNTTDEPNESDSPFGAVPLVELETGPRAVSVSGPYIEHGGPSVAVDIEHGGPSVAVESVSTATADEPVTIRLTLTNENDWEDTFRLSDVPGFHDVNTTRRRVSQFDRHFEDTSGLDRPESTLYLAPTETHNLIDEGAEPERGPDGYWRTPDVPPKLPSTVTLDAGESVTGEYYLLGHWERTGFPTGSYEFGHTNQSLTLNVWDTERPGPDEESVFSRSVPSLDDERETPWFHDATSESTVYLEPAVERADPPAELAFRLVNRSKEPLGGNPYDWGLYKLVDGAWHFVAPRFVNQPFTAISPGDSFDYELYAFHEDGFEVSDCDADVGVSVGHLGGGIYAFESGFSTEDSANPAALFELDAPALELTRTDDATVSVDGDRATVTLPEWDDGQHPPNATLTVEPAPGASADRSFVAEQVVRRQYRALRNALATLPDTARVTVRANEHVVENVVGYDSTALTFAYDGTTYRATATVDS